MTANGLQIVTEIFMLVCEIKRGDDKAHLALPGLFERLKEDDVVNSIQYSLANSGDYQTALEFASASFKEEETSMDHISTSYLSSVYAFMIGDYQRCTQLLATGKELVDKWCREAISRNVMDKRGCVDSGEHHPVFSGLLLLVMLSDAM